MKFQTYNEQVPLNTVSAEVKGTGAPKFNAGAGMAALAKGLGTIGAVIQKKNDEDDQQAAFKAINEYNKQTYAMMYDGDNALMNVTGSRAANIGEQYKVGEKDIRDAILKEVKFHDGRNKLALENMLDRQALSHTEAISKRQYQQHIVAQKDDIDNGLQTSQLAIQKNFADPNAVASQAAYLELMCNSYFPNMSWKERLAIKKQTLGAFYATGIQAAIDANDTIAYNNLMKAGEGYLSAQQYENFNKIHTAYAKDDSMRKMAHAAASSGKSWKTFEAELRKSGTPTGGTDINSALPYLAQATREQESSGNYNAGNSLYPEIFGAYQFSEGTYARYAKEAGVDPSDRSKEAQDKVYAAYARDVGGQYGIEAAIVAHYAGVANAERWAKNMPTAVGDNGQEYSWDQKQAGGMPSVREYLQQVKDKMKQAGYTGDVGSRAYTEREIDQFHSMFTAYENQNKHEKTVADLNDFKYGKEYIYNNFIAPDNGTGTMRPLDEALAWARKQGGNDLDKAKKYEDAVKDWYKIYGVNTTNGGKGPVLDEYELDELLLQGISQNDLRHGLAERGYNQSQVNKALARWKQHYERKGTFSVNKNDILAVVMDGKKVSSLTNEERAKREGAWKWILNEAAKIEATTNKGEPIEDYQLMELAEKAKEEMNMGGGMFPQGRLVPYSSGTKFNHARASFLGYKVSPTGDGVHWNVERPDEAGDRVSAWLTDEEMAQEIDEKWKQRFNK